MTSPTRRSSGGRHVFDQVALRFSAAGSGLTSGSIHIRARTGTDAVLWVFVLASFPAWCVRAWMTGAQVLGLAPGDVPTGWREGLLTWLGLSTTSADLLASLAIGFTYLLPLLLVTSLVSLFWAGVFATIRKRSVDAGWFLAPWLYVLLLPADLSPVLAAMGLSFGLVIGLHVFGGTGYYVATPAAVGVLFVQFSYPGAAVLTLDAGWMNAVSGNPTTGVPAMFIACAVGALVLLRAGICSPGTLLGAVISVSLAAAIAGAIGDSMIAGLGPDVHLLLGSLPVCLAFLLTDPTTASLTRGGRWLHGAMFGILVVAIRVLDPEHPDGALIAVLLAGLCVPLIDYVLTRRRARTRLGRLELRT